MTQVAVGVAVGGVKREVSKIWMTQDEDGCTEPEAGKVGKGGQVAVGIGVRGSHRDSPLFIVTRHYPADRQPSCVKSCTI